MSGAPILSEGEQADGADEDEFFAEGDAEIVDTIKELIETRVPPAEANDGGDITFLGLQGRNRVPEHEGLLRRLPLLHRR